MWLEMSMSGYKWLHEVTIDYRCQRIATSVYKWQRVVKSDHKVVIGGDKKSAHK